MYNDRAALVEQVGKHPFLSFLSEAEYFHSRQLDGNTDPGPIFLGVSVSERQTKLISLFTRQSGLALLDPTPKPVSF